MTFPLQPAVAALILVILVSLAGQSPAAEGRSRGTSPTPPPRARSAIELFTHQGGTKNIPAARHRIKLNLDAIGTTAEEILPEMLEAELRGRKVKIAKKRRVHRGEGDFSWFGAVVDDELSAVILSVKNGVLHGSILDRKGEHRVRYDNGEYLLEEIPTGPALLANDTVRADAAPTDLLPSGPFPLAPLAPTVPADDGQRLDLLVFHTKRMQDRYGVGLEAYIQNLVDAANLSYLNSNIATSLNVVHTALLDSQTMAEPTAIETVLAALTNDAGAKALRDTYAADLVTLLRDYSGGTKCGQAWIMGQGLVGPQFANLSYSVVETGASCRTTTLAHEIGHNLGCAHDPDHATEAGAFPYSYGYDVAGLFGTIMSYDGPTIPYFSTPLITYKNVPIGLDGAADNTRSITNTKAVVAGFRIAQIQPEFSATATNGFTPFTVGFSDRSTGRILTHYWDFGDGASSSEAHPIHTYAVPGVYSVALTVANQENTESLSKTGFITVVHQTPCPITLAPLLPVHGGATSTGSIDVLTSPTCSWNAVSSNGWAEITAGGTGQGAGRILYTLQTNPEATQRLASLITAGNPATMQQLSFPAGMCDPGAGQRETLPLYIPNLLGWSVAVTDGFAVAGVPTSIKSPTAGNAVILYEKVGASWSQTARISAVEAGETGVFGKSVAISEPGSQVIVGSPRSATNPALGPAGSPCILGRSGGQWSLDAKLEPPAEASGIFGSAVAISGDHAFVGDAAAGIVAVYVTTGPGLWSRETVLSPAQLTTASTFGAEIAFHGGRLIVGDPGEASAYIFSQNDSQWTQEAKLSTDAPAGTSHFGVDVALFLNQAVVGDNLNKSVSIFERDGTGWRLTARLQDAASFPADFGNYLALTQNRIAVGSPAGRTVYLFMGQGSQWDATGTIAAPAGVGSTTFGAGLAMAATSVMVGSPLEGTIRVPTGAVTFYNNSCTGADLCPSDPTKTQAGICGCGATDTDADSDGTADCIDLCPNDPNTTQACETYDWDAGAWSECSVTCGDGTQTRPVVCKRSSGATVADSSCTGVKPANDQSCNAGVPVSYYRDNDGDGYGNPANATAACSLPQGFVPDKNDCNDADAKIKPGAIEICDGVDNDCNGQVDEGIKTTFYRDADGDGFGIATTMQQGCTAPLGFVTDKTDCDDADPAAHPGQLWYRDADGDGYGDGTVDSASCTRPAGFYLAGELVALAGDCNDGSRFIFPGAVDLICDGIDQNCDGKDGQGLAGNCQDRDGDGMPDLWESAHGLDPLNNDALLDKDGDGVKNIDEFLGATDPGAKNPLISGIVTDSAGVPMADVQIEAISMALSASFSGVTGDDGAYDIVVAPAGDYRVMALAGGNYQPTFFADAGSWAEAVQLDLTSHSAVADFVLATGATLKGTVTGLTSGDYAYLQAWSESLSAGNHASVLGTGEALSFQIGGLGVADDYRISVLAGAHGQGYVQADGTLGPWEGAALFGSGEAGITVSLTLGHAIAGVISGLAQGRSAFLAAMTSDGMVRGSTQIMASGNGSEAYAIAGLPDGNYFVSIWADGYGNGFWAGNSLGESSAPLNSEAATLVMVQGGDVAGAHFTMNAGLTLCGAVRGLSAGDRAWISAWSESLGLMQTMMVTGAGANSDAYTVTGLAAAADYLLSITAEGYFDGYYGTTGIVTLEKALALIVPDQGSRDFTLTKGTAINGAVTGLELGEAAVLTAWSEVTGGWASARILGRGRGIAVAYTLNGLPPAADYEISFHPDDHLNDTRRGVDSTQIQAVNFVAGAAAVISGAITGARANSYVIVEGVCLTTGDHKNEAVLTNGVGNSSYTIQGVAAGKYLVSARNGGEIVYYNQTRNSRSASELDLATGSRSGIDFNFGVTAYAVTGTIAGLPDRRPVVVTAWDDTNGGWATVAREGNGPFQLALPAGRYWIGIFAAGCGELYFAGSGMVTSDWLAATALDVAAATALGTLTLTPGYAVSGRVYYDANGNSQYEPGEELGGLAVTVSSGNLQRDGITDSAGRYTVNGLATGRTYDIVVASLFGSHAGQVTLRGADVVYDIRLGGTDTARIAVTVTRGGTPAVSAMVLLSGPQGFINAVLTDGIGQGFFAGLPTDRSYSIKVDHDIDGTVDYNATGATTFTVAAGENRHEVSLP